MEKILKREVLYTGKIFNVQKLTIEVSPGEIVEWEIVDKGAYSIGILPITSSGEFVLIEEYFGAVNKRMLSLPKGTPEKNESFEDTALRELQEEVGLTGDLKPLIKTEISPSYLTQSTVIFLATNLEVKKRVGDEKEYLRPVYLKFDIAYEMIKKGQITESRAVTAILMYKFFYA